MTSTNSRIHGTFAGKTRTAAPVQTEEDGWFNYLSKKEQLKLQNADKQSDRGFYYMLGAFALTQVPKLLVGVTLGSTLSWLVGAGLGLYGIGKMATNGYRAYSLKSEGERREGEVEVMRKHGVTPRKPQY